MAIENPPLPAWRANMGYFKGEREAAKNVLEIGCINWADFRTRIISDFFPDGMFRKGRYLFRGQGSGEWKLSTSFDRWYRGERDKKNKMADFLLSEFAVECELEDMPQT